jgi:AraC-like DNA-binding protein
MQLWRAAEAADKDKVEMASTLITFEDRPSDSPVVERVWRSRSDRAGIFLSMASCHCVMVVTRHDGKTFLTVRGPETRATIADCPAEGEWIGIYFKLGTFMPLLPARVLRDRNDVRLPAASDRSFWLNGSAWEYPSFENAETFVARLLKQQLIATDPHVQDALRGSTRGLSLRTQQRRFVRATGMAYATIRQIERARDATNRLRNGARIADVAYDTGYFDQAHLTRSLQRFIGQTPAQIAGGQEQLSLLYNTDAG